MRTFVIRLLEDMATMNVFLVDGACVARLADVVESEGRSSPSDLGEGLLSRVTRSSVSRGR